MLFTPRPKGLGKENFLKLNDQEEVTGIFKGDIHTFKQHWANGKSFECVGQECSYCKCRGQDCSCEGDSKKHYPGFRFRINFVTPNEGQWKAKIFEGGGELYDFLTSLDKKFDLTRTLIDITRRGMKQETKYDILPRVDQPITQEMAAKIQAAPLLALSTVGDASSAA